MKKIDKIKIKRTIPGILIEGEDYSGKSTIANLLEQKLSGTLNKKIIYNHYYLNSHELVSFLVNQAQCSIDKEKKFKIFAAAAIIDYDLFEMKPNHFYIQDRNWLSHICKNKFANKNIIFKRHLPFDYNVFLMVAPDEQKKRMPQEAEIEKLSYGKGSIKRLIPSNENWLFIDTSNKSISNVINEIISFIEK